MALFLYETALDSINDNNFELAIINLNELIEKFPMGEFITSAHLLKGDAYSELEDWKSASKSYLESFQLNPNGTHAAKALMNVGIGLGKMQKINEACNILSRVEVRFPRNQIVEEAQYEMQILGCGS
jgi:TolA-binding protein